MQTSNINDSLNQEQLLQQLIEKNNQLNTLLENSPLLVYMKDKDLNYITGSKYAKEFVDSGIDRYADRDVQIDMSAARDLTLSEDKFVLETKETLIKEKMALDFEKNPHWYNICKAPIIKTNGKVDGLVTITRNIDIEKHAELQKELFVATITHDIKNPIIGQINIIKLLLNGTFGELNEEQRDILNTMLESTTFLSELLHSLLATYKADNGYLKLNKTKFSLKEFIAKCTNEASIVAKCKNVMIKFKSNIDNADDFLIEADEMQIRRVISNLISNSIEYAFKNTDITIYSEISNDNVRISIENLSQEIPKEIKEHMFEKYNTTVMTKQKRGFGLGLYLSKMIVEAHEGTIFFDGDKNRNCFGFSLPRSN